MSASPKSTQGQKQGAERRRTRRRSILDSFSLFAVVPKKGVHRLPVQDISDLGIGFDIDIPGESEEDFPVKSGEALDLQLYLNQSLYLTLKVKIARIESVEEAGMPVRRVGAEFLEQDKPGYKGLVAFVEMLDRIAEIAELQ